MLRYTRAITARSLRRIRLLEVFRMTVSDISNEKDGDDEDAWERIAPDGGIYQLNALEAEHLKHQEDLQSQFWALTVQFKALLEPALKEAQVEKLQPAAMPPEYRLLLHTLRKTNVQDAQVDTEQGGLKSGYMPLTEFLLSGGTTRLLGGAVLLPADPGARVRSIKNRLFALLIFVIQLISPVMLLWSSWRTPEIQGIVRALPRRFGSLSAAANEVVCLGSTKKAFNSIMGASLVVLVMEIMRAYCHSQVHNAAKAQMLPNDKTWRVIGQFANMWCIFFSAIATPMILMDEHSTHDLLFDALAVLFIFTLDDIGGDALTYLRLENEEFQRLSSWTMGALIQCPRKICDIVDPNAATLQELFKITLGSDGLKAASGPDAGQRCKTRLMEDTEPTEASPLKAVYLPSATPSWVLKDHRSSLPYESLAFQYCVSHMDPKTGEPHVCRLVPHTSALVVGWNLLAAFLMLWEIVTPISFIILYTPCQHGS